ncbi:MULTISPECIES: twin-arginine translocase TatA/TatE family subunit [unclassified Streptomyces]|uniref:twin-arginine translocase TatA/TatE family subunit n=1 Tax=unclassified Streptomyces TaxID=2593676 RepID=UPI0006F4DCD7|nr:MULTISPECIES: twin-arginine translocase TatA/TatE family subunit [unclassified Streptomyces]KQX52868.1 hypothetical protein ASD33_06345 [Streptomyces sp. Root1304]KRA89783.1 hypothetical protein ASE09_06350 [Streptomyces sp. Root66D1]
MFGISEIAILLIVVIVLLGAKKLPELARNAGKAARILKSEGKAMKAEGTPEPQVTYQVTDTPAAPAAPGSAGTGAGAGARPGTPGS